MKLKHKKEFKKYIGRFVIFALLFSLLVIVSLSFVGAANHTVAGNTFGDIQSVVDNSDSGDIIVLDNITYSGSGSYIRVNKSLTIQGESSDKFATLDARHLSRIIVVSNVSLVTFKYITFVNGDSVFPAGGGVAGGSVRSDSNLYVSDCVFKNSIGGSGGALFITGSTGSTVINTLFINNHGDVDDEDTYTEGGGLDIHGSNSKIINCTFINNSATSSGGALSLIEGTGNQIINCTFINNTATSGGAIRLNIVTAIVDGCNFTNNQVDGNGAGIVILNSLGTLNSIVTIKGSIFNNNKALLGGGAIYATSDNDMINIVDSYFNNNQANNGGALHILCDLELVSSNFTNNQANTGNAGGIYSDNSILIQNNNFKNNIGNAVILMGDGTKITGNNFTGNTEHGIRSTNLKNAIINNNQFLNNGGTGLYIIGSGNKVYSNLFNANNVGVIVSGNSTDFTGNVVINSKSDGVRLTGNNIKFVSNNITSNNGHGLVLNGNNPTISNNIFTSNNYGINGQSLANGVINNNNFSNNRGTALFAKGANNKIYKNNFSTNNIGAYVVGDNTDFKDNNVRNNLLQGVIFVGNCVYVGYNNFTNNKRNAIKITGNYSTIERNLVTGNSVNQAGCCVVIVSGNYAKVRYNAVKNNNYHGIHILGNNAEAKYNVLSNNVGGELTVGGNKAVIQYNNVSYGKGKGISLVGNNSDVSYNNAHHDNQIGIAIRGNNNKIYKNTANYNKGQGLFFIGNSSKITDNKFNYNIKNGIKGEGNKNLIKNNNILNNSKNGKFCAIFFKGNYNNYTTNKIYNNGYHGLHIEGKNNRIFNSVLKANKATQGVVVGNNNYLYNLTVYGGSKSGLGIYGHYNKLLNSKIQKNKANGIGIKGNYNQLNKNTINSNNKTGIYINGSKNKIIQNIIRANNIGIYHKTGKNSYYNYNNIVNKKYNLYLAKGSVNAEYNWWGKNSKYKVKGAKINRYVVAYLNAPNTLKLKKTYNINVKFRDNKNKKLKLPIPSLNVKFSFDGDFSPYSYKVTKNIAKGKIRVSQYGFYTLMAKVDGQKLYKYYIGDSNGKVYDLNTYVKKLFKKERVTANQALISQTAKTVLKNVQKSLAVSKPAVKSNKESNWMSQIGDFFNTPVFTIPGYNGLDNFNLFGLPVGQGIKTALDVLFCIDENGTMTVGGLAINLASLALTLLTAGLGTAALKSLPSIAKFGDDIIKIASKYLPGISKVSFETIKDFGMGIVKLIGGNPVPLLVKSLKSAGSKVLKGRGDNIKLLNNAWNVATGGFSSFLKVGNSYLKEAFKYFIPTNKVQSFIKNASNYLSYNLDLKAISKAITEGPANIMNAVNIAKNAAVSTAKKAIVVAKNAAKKAVNTVKSVVKKAANTVKVVAKKAQQVYNAGKKFVHNVYNGAKSVAKTVYNGAKSVVKNVYNGAKKTLGSVYNAVKNFKLW